MPPVKKLAAKKCKQPATEVEKEAHAVSLKKHALQAYKARVTKNKQ
jgi:hypothetical protein